MEKTSSQTGETPRATRYIGRQALRRLTTDMRCFDCGRQTINADGAVGVRLSEGVAGFAGLSTCGRIWLCPVCNSKVMARRAMEVGAMLAWAERAGYWVLFGALTSRHEASSDLEALFELHEAAWRRVVNGRRWREVSGTETVTHAHTASCGGSCERKRDTVIKAALHSGRIGYVRAAELTIGRNGWHPHYHPLIIVKGSRLLAQRLADELVADWVIAVEAEGGEARIAGGQRMSVLARGKGFEAVAGYVTKATYDATALALEMVWSQGKTSRGRAHSTAPHWSILAEFAQGDYRRSSRWDELEEASAGRRMISWSRGLRVLAGVGAEDADEDVAAAEVGSVEDTVAYITPDGWRSIRDEPELIATYLELLESEGWGALRSRLESDGVEHFTRENAGPATTGTRVNPEYASAAR